MTNGGLDGVSLSTGEINLSTGWYTIDGRKLDGEPTKHGLYIHNGKKVVK